MTIQDVLKECGWDDVLISHFVDQGIETYEDDIICHETTFTIDNTKLFLNDNTKKYMTAFYIK